MTHHTPSGTRDVLPDEMRELRAITDAVRHTFEARGYGEIYTPALEYEQVLARGEAHAADPAYRLFDEQGDVLVLRSDMTIPIARVVANRYENAPTPLRFCYVAHAYRSVRPKRGEAREMLQAGIELVGAPAPIGTAEAITVLCETLAAAGLESFRIGLGDAALFPALLQALGVDEVGTSAVLEKLAQRDFVGLSHVLTALSIPAEDAERVQGVAQRRGGPEVLAPGDGVLAEAARGLRDVHELLDRDVAERVIFDLGLTQRLGYYTGAVFEVYDAALGAPIGSGGRYDDLLGRFGRSLPAVGWALNVERLHLAAAAEKERRAWA